MLIAAPAGAAEPAVENAAAESLAFLSARSRDRQVELSAALLGAPDTAANAQRHFKLRLDPLLSGLAAALQRHGLPVEEIRDGRKAIALSASLHVGANLPDLRLHLGDRTPEPFGAFYASHKGVRWAAVWPIRNVTLRVEGGKDSEFGYLAIAGLQWSHPEKPIAIGIGIPAHMKRADGVFGAIVQVRAKFGRWPQD